MLLNKENEQGYYYIKVPIYFENISVIIMGGGVLAIT